MDRFLGKREKKKKERGTCIVTGGQESFLPFSLLFFLPIPIAVLTCSLLVRNSPKSLRAAASHQKYNSPHHRGFWAGRAYIENADHCFSLDRVWRPWRGPVACGVSESLRNLLEIRSPGSRLTACERPSRWFWSMLGQRITTPGEADLAM